MPALLAKTPEAHDLILCHFSSKGPMGKRAIVILLKNDAAQEEAPHLEALAA